MYKKLEDLAQQYNLPMSSVVTAWDVRTHKIMRRDYLFANDDLGRIQESADAYHKSQMRSLEIITRYLRRENK